MKFNESKVIILLSSMILGFLLASQLSFGKLIPREVLTLQNYQQMSSELRQINDENSILVETRRKLNAKLAEYKYTGQSESDKIDKLSEELNMHDFNIGMTDVKGPGIVISLSDSPFYGRIIDTREESEYGIIQDSDIMLVHDMDILRLVWELKNAGAEAVSVNDQRIIHNTDIYCGGPVIYVNGLELVPPYIIKAIGNPDNLYYAMNKEDSYYKWLEDRELNVFLRQEDEIKILRYDRNIYYKYLVPVKD